MSKKFFLSVNPKNSQNTRFQYALVLIFLLLFFLSLFLLKSYSTAPMDKMELEIRGEEENM